MKRVKKPKPNKKTMTEKELAKLIVNATEDAVAKASMLYLTAMKDEFGFGLDDVTRVFKRAERYAEYLNSHMAEMKDLAETLEKDTGIKITWRE